MTLILSGTDNSATSPAVTGTDTDTGIYYPTSNQVAIATNGTQAMLVNASQNTTFAGTLTTAAQGIAKASLPAGAVLQVVNVQTGAYASTTAIIPFDNTIPQNTEGTELFTVAITPISATSKLFISATLQMTQNPGNWVVIAIFQGSTANAVTATAGYIASATGGFPISLTNYMTAGTTSSTTFKLRYGPGNSGTTSVNSNGSGQLFGGVCISSMTIMEIAA
jgi:hypothetical protein